MSNTQQNKVGIRIFMQELRDIITLIPIDKIQLLDIAVVLDKNTIEHETMKGLIDIGFFQEDNGSWEHHDETVLHHDNGSTSFNLTVVLPDDSTT